MFLKNKNIIFKIRRSKVTDYAALSKHFECKIVIIFLPICLNMCFGCSKEPSHQDGSLEYPQHVFVYKENKKSLKCPLLSGELEYCLIQS